MESPEELVQRIFPGVSISTEDTRVILRNLSGYWPETSRSAKSHIQDLKRIGYSDEEIRQCDIRPARFGDIGPSILKLILDYDKWCTGEIEEDWDLLIDHILFGTLMQWQLMKLKYPGDQLITVIKELHARRLRKFRGVNRQEFCFLFLFSRSLNWAEEFRDAFDGAHYGLASLQEICNVYPKGERISALLAEEEAFDPPERAYGVRWLTSLFDLGWYEYDQCWDGEPSSFIQFELRDSLLYEKNVEKLEGELERFVGM